MTNNSLPLILKNYVQGTNTWKGETQLSENKRLHLLPKQMTWKNMQKNPKTNQKMKIKEIKLYTICKHKSIHRQAGIGNIVL